MSKELIMSKELTIFNYGEEEIKVMMDEKGNPRWIASEITDILGIVRSRDAVSRLDDDEKADAVLNRTSSNGVIQNRNITIINESGLYSLILSSRKPQAKAFKRWITHEVLPAIRKTGGYIVGENDMTEDELLSAAFIVANRKIEERDKLIAEAKPKVEYFYRVRDAINTHSFNEAAKILGRGRNKLMKQMREDGILTSSNLPSKRNLPYQRYIDSGYFEVKESVYGTDFKLISYTPRVTGKGMQWLSKKYK